MPFNPRFNYADTSASNLKDEEMMTPFNLSSDDYEIIKDIIADYLIANNLLTVSLKDKGSSKLLNSLHPAIVTDIESKLGATTFTGVPSAYVSFWLHILAKKVKQVKKRKTTPGKRGVDESSETSETKRQRTSEAPNVKTEGSTSGAFSHQDSKANILSRPPPLPSDPRLIDNMLLHCEREDDSSIEMFNTVWDILPDDITYGVKPLFWHTKLEVYRRLLTSGAILKESDDVLMGWLHRNNREQLVPVNNNQSHFHACLLSQLRDRSYEHLEFVVKSNPASGKLPAKYNTIVL